MNRFKKSTGGVRLTNELATALRAEGQKRQPPVTLNSMANWAIQQWLVSQAGHKLKKDAP